MASEKDNTEIIWSNNFHVSFIFKVNLEGRSVYHLSNRLCMRQSFRWVNNLIYFNISTVAKRYTFVLEKQLQTKHYPFGLSCDEICFIVFSEILNDFFLRLSIEFNKVLVSNLQKKLWLDCAGIDILVKLNRFKLTAVPKRQSSCLCSCPRY